MLHTIRIHHPKQISRAHALVALILTLLFFVSSVEQTTAAQSPERQPNIILIMADDLGAESLGCYGNSVYSTPHLDSMAAEGAWFENAFTTPVCSPTRAMILTGLYPNRTGILERLDSPLDRERTNRLPVHLQTFGQLFRSAGYATAISGKWHLGDFQSHPDQPASHGFDEYCLWVQYWDGQRRSRYYAPHNWENGEYKAHSKDVFGPDYYCQFILDFIERNRDRPFLAYYPMNLVHGPLIEPPDLKELARSQFPDDLRTNEQKFGHMVTYMDAIVGRILSKVKELGLDERTIVIFTGDNGCASSLESRLGSFRLKGGKRTMNEAGTRVPFIARWPGKFPTGKRDSMLSLMDMLPTLAALAGLPVPSDIDGLDLSHTLLGKLGADRQYFEMAFEGDVYFVRDKRFRLHEDGRFYDVPVNSNESRYSMEALVNESEQIEARKRLQARLSAYMQIQKRDDSYRIFPFGTGGDAFKNAQDGARQRAGK